MDGYFNFMRCLLLLTLVELTWTQSVRYPLLKIANPCQGEWSDCVVVTDCKAARSKIKSGQNPKICGWSSELPLVCCPKVEGKVLPEDESQISKLSPDGCGKRSLGTNTGETSPQVGGGLIFLPAASRILDSGIEPRRVYREVAANSPTLEPIDDEPIEGNFFMFAVGGNTATEKWPWMVAIFHGKGNKHLCGGTLIDERHVVSAAHCFVGKSLEPAQYKVQIGELTLSEGNFEYEVADIRLHEGYRRRYYYDDIAILRLSEAQTAVTPACLPSDNVLRHGDNVTVLGWGDLSYGGPSTSKLQEVAGIPIVERSECDSKFRTLPGVPFPRGITDNFLCAGLQEGGKDACQGDSGGPLLYEHSQDHWTLVGVVSFGYKCGEPGYPGVYTKMASYIPWIEEYIEDQNEVVTQSRHFEYVEGRPIWKSFEERKGEKMF